MADIMYLKVHRCARCGEDHALLEFKKFKTPIDLTTIPGDLLLMTYWSMCPVTNEPVLMRIVDPGDENKET